MRSDDSTFRILGLCTSQPGSARATERLRRLTTEFDCWDALLKHAEDDGLEPLLRTHLLESAICVPPDVADRLRVRWMQQAHACAIRTRVTTVVLRALEDNGVPHMLLKGSALAHLVYRSPVLRPMRDVDVLVRSRDVKRAADVLEKCGFAGSGLAVPSHHHHIGALSTTLDGATVTIEVHHQLLPAIPFLRPIEYEDVYRDAQSFEWSGHEVRTLGREDMLWHVYAHAFAINVTRPAIRLISVADLVAMTEAWIDEIDWEQLKRRYRRVWRALPLLHHLTPWSSRVLAKLRWDVSRIPNGVRPIAPRLAWSATACRDVMWPPEWWLCTRYGVQRWPHRVWCRTVEHPVRLMIAAGQWARRRSA